MRTIEQILKRYCAAQARQQQWESLAREAYQMAMPERNVFDKHEEGEDNSEGIYDSTAIISANSFVATMQQN